MVTVEKITRKTFEGEGSNSYIDDVVEKDVHKTGKRVGISDVGILTVFDAERTPVAGYSAGSWISYTYS